MGEFAGGFEGGGEVGSDFAFGEPCFQSLRGLREVYKDCVAEPLGQIVETLHSKSHLLVVIVHESDVYKMFSIVNVSATQFVLVLLIDPPCLAPQFFKVRLPLSAKIL